MTRRFFSVAAVVFLNSIVFLSPHTPCWGLIGPPQKVQVFSHQRFGRPLLQPGTGSAKTANVPDEVLAAWEGFRSVKGAQDAKIDFSGRTGLPHSVWNFKVSVSGKTLQEKARSFLEQNRVLFLKGNDLSNLSYEKTRRGTFGSGHVDFLQKYKGWRVYGAGITVHFDSEKNVVMVNGDYVPGLVLTGGEPGKGELPPDEALRIALDRLGAQADGLYPACEPETAVYCKHPGKSGNFLIYRYELLGSGWGSHHILMADAFTGEPLAFFPTAFFLEGTVTVYDPNSLTSAVRRTITNLDDSGFLRGDLIVVLDEENPRAQSAERKFEYTPETPSFRQASVYYYLTETRKRLRQIGFDDTAAGVLPTIANALDKTTGGGFNNAFFNPLSKGFVFGNGDGVNTTNLSQDFDVAAHEFGHFFDDTLINTEQTPLHSPRRAWGEAAGDTIAAIINGDPTSPRPSGPVPLPSLLSATSTTPSAIRTIWSTKNTPTGRSSGAPTGISWNWSAVGR